MSDLISVVVVPSAQELAETALAVVRVLLPSDAPESTILADLGEAIARALPLVNATTGSANDLAPLITRNAGRCLVFRGKPLAARIESRVILDGDEPVPAPKLEAVAKRGRKRSNREIDAAIDAARLAFDEAVKRGGQLDCPYSRRSPEGRAWANWVALRNEAAKVAASGEK